MTKRKETGADCGALELISRLSGSDISIHEMIPKMVLVSDQFTKNGVLSVLKSGRFKKLNDAIIHMRVSSNTDLN